MARRALTFVCQNCGAVYGRWQGKCEACGEWNTIAEEVAGNAAQRAGPGAAGAARAGRSRSIRSPARPTMRRAPPPGIAELDRVTGGGFVRGSVLLVGGDPGIGKSTLLIQAAAAVARGGRPRRLHLGRGGGGAGAAARRAARPRRRRRSSSPPRPRSRTSWRRSPHGETPRLVVIEFDPDHVDRCHRIGARHGEPGARRRPGADPLRQALAAPP